MREQLKEIVKQAEASFEKVTDETVNIMVNDQISIGGTLDSIMLLAKDALESSDPHKDNIDRVERHSISGHMNDPSAMQKKGFDND